LISLGSIFGAARKNHVSMRYFQNAIELTYACWRLIEIDSIVVVGNGLGLGGEIQINFSQMSKSLCGKTLP
jgi:hypothetical protein